RLAFVCWRSAEENAWATEPLAAVLPLLREPPAPTPPEAPGPFSLADGERLRAVLAGAGFAAISIEPLDTPYVLGPTPEAAAEVMLHIGPLGRLVREQGLDREQFRGRIVEVLARHPGPSGPQLPAACWVASATA